MRYVYVVTRYVKGEPAGTASIPNLGIHSNEKAAQRHFRSVVESRTESGYTLHWDHVGYAKTPNELYGLLRQAFVSKDGEYETLRLEQWKA